MLLSYKYELILLSHVKRTDRLPIWKANGSVSDQFRYSPHTSLEILSAWLNLSRLAGRYTHTVWLRFRRRCIFDSLSEVIFGVPSVVFLYTCYGPAVPGVVGSIQVVSFRILYWYGFVTFFVTSALKNCVCQISDGLCAIVWAWCRPSGQCVRLPPQPIRFLFGGSPSQGNGTHQRAAFLPSKVSPPSRSVPALKCEFLIPTRESMHAQ